MSHPHPWHDLRDNHPEWSVVWRRLPLGLYGHTDHGRREIILDRDQLQSQRRTTLAHELYHVRHGDTHACDAKAERWIERQVARELIPHQLLAEAVKWAGGNLSELAEELWVDEDLLAVRARWMHPAERAVLRRIIARREPAA